MVELPLKSMSLFKGLSQRLHTPTDRRLGCLQLPLQQSNPSAQFWKKEDKLRSK